MHIGLRVDVDTLRGTKHGVPTLVRIMKKHNVHATYFFSVGPDNMGRHLWRLLKPKFLWKMLRTKAASLYGPEIVLMGTAWPGLRIGKRCEAEIRACAADGHEMGLHAWDHHEWQAHIRKMKPEAIEKHIRLAYDEMTRILGTPPTCSAVPGWVCTEDTLRIKESFHFKFNSDCRGICPFMPEVGEWTRLTTPQIPLTMPTYDELYGRDGVTNDNYNVRLLDYAGDDIPNTLTIHAEVEGGICADLFDKFLSDAIAKGITFGPLSSLLPPNPQKLPPGALRNGWIPGREGLLSIQRELPDEP